jgi:hypothetical protein
VRIGRQLRLVLLDEVLGLPTGAVDHFINVLGIAPRQRGDDVADARQPDAAHPAHRCLLADARCARSDPESEPAAAHRVRHDPSASSEDRRPHYREREPHSHRACFMLPRGRDVQPRRAQAATVWTVAWRARKPAIKGVMPRVVGAFWCALAHSTTWPLAHGASCGGADTQLGWDLGPMPRRRWRGMVCVLVVCALRLPDRIKPRARSLDVLVQSKRDKRAALGPASSKVSRDHGSEVFHPAAYRLIGNHDPALSQQVLDIAEAEGEPNIEPDALLNDYGWEAISGVADLGHYPHLRPRILADKPVNVTKPCRQMHWALANTDRTTGHCETLIRAKVVGNAAAPSVPSTLAGCSQAQFVTMARARREQPPSRRHSSWENRKTDAHTAAESSVSSPTTILASAFVARPARTNSQRKRRETTCT